MTVNTVEGLGVDAPDQTCTLFSTKSRFRIAPFAINFQRGGAPSLAADGSIVELDWDEQVRIARLADEAGFEAIIAAARWRGYAGDAHWAQQTYEPTPWAAGIAAVTNRIMVFSTIHTPLYHPVQAAKLAATVDHISHGRFAMNIVSGWNVREFDMFDYVQREHDDRYAFSAEWTTFVKRLWSEEAEFDLDGEHFRARGAYSAPKPIQSPRPPLMSAGSSDAGRQFAATHADLAFVTGRNLDELAAAAADVRRRAGELGRKIQVWAAGVMICGETKADAQRMFDHFVTQNGDAKAAEDSLRLQIAGKGQSVKWEVTPEMIKERMVGSLGNRLIGGPEEIVEGMQRLNSAGIDGMACSWFNYEEGITAFRDLVQPLAVDAGLRA
jgi:alkanesulfonate monooxygenase SsuD/methylene tetrahydromethanopterin reductase-like flavin-dependent oxidoreductase (luciferase family)